MTQWVDSKRNKTPADGKPFTLLMSEHLPVHLNLPVRTYPPCSMLQALVLGEGLEFFILTLYDAKKKDLDQDVRGFTMRCARVLTSQLLNYCGEDFILLPCTLEMKCFDCLSLTKELKNQLSRATRYYSGPLELTKESCQHLQQAVLILATVSEVPFYFDGKEDAGKALLMADPVSDCVLRRTISQLMTEDATCSTQELYNKQVVLEAAGRVSYRQNVVIVSDDQDIADCVKKLPVAVSSYFQCYTEEDARARFVNATSLDIIIPDSDSGISCSESPSALDIIIPDSDSGISCSESPSDTASESVSTTEKRGSTTGVRHDLRVAECTDSIPDDEIQQCSEPPAETVPTLNTADPAPKGGINGEERSLEDVHELQDRQSHVVCATSDEAQPNSEETPPCEENNNSAATSRDTEQGRGVPVKEKPEDVCIIAIDTPGFPDCPGLRLRLMKGKKNG